MQRIARIPLAGLRSYLFKRTRIRFFGNGEAGGKHTVRVLGNSVQLDSADVEQRYFIENCIREPENIFIYIALARSGLCKTFVDVGANFGQVSSSIYPHYQKLVLVDANPNAAEVLRQIYQGKDNVRIENLALVDSPEVREVTLTVPLGSSGLGTIGESDEAAAGGRRYTCKAATLDQLLENTADAQTYVKIDVEGFEEQVIKGGLRLIREKSPLVGFEALSRDVAARCCSHFPDHQFYFARFGFLNASGALTQSWGGVLKALLAGGHIDLYRFAQIETVPIENYTQIIAVPNTRTAQFEQCLLQQVSETGVLRVS